MKRIHPNDQLKAIAEEHGLTLGRDLRFLTEEDREDFYHGWTAFNNAALFSVQHVYETVHVDYRRRLFLALAKIGMVNRDWTIEPFEWSPRHVYPSRSFEDRRRDMWLGQMTEVSHLALQLTDLKTSRDIAMSLKSTLNRFLFDESYNFPKLSYNPINELSY
jgi:hypothetical protein